MKITLPIEDQRKLDDILYQKDENFAVSSLLNSFLENKFDAISTQAVKELMDKEGFHETEAIEEAFYQIQCLDSTDPEIEQFRKDTSFGKLIPVDEDFFLNQPFNHLPIKDVIYGPYQLKYNYFSPYEIFNLDDTIGDKENRYAEINRLGYFRRTVKYLLLSYKDEVWMSITPHEINTMKEYIEKAKGNVLTFGLGLGYYAYEVASKDEVTSITIIEKDSKVISLFEKNILPFIPNKEKIKIIKQDAFLYFERELRNEHFDTIFIDIYHTPDDALPLYLRFKEDEKKLGYQACQYWIEKSILCLLRRYVLTLIEEYFQGFSLKDYQNVIDEETKILLFLFKKLEKKEFTSFDQIDHFISDEGLKEFMRQ